MTKNIRKLILNKIKCQNKKGLLGFFLVTATNIKLVPKIAFKKNNINFLIGMIVSLASLLWLINKFDFYEITDTLETINIGYLIPIPLLILASFLLRTQRWRLLIKHKAPISYWSTFKALMIGQLLNNILPARAGDIARALELARAERISRTMVFTSLITEKLTDLFAILAVLSLISFGYPSLPIWLQKLGIIVACFAGGTILLLFLAHIIGDIWLYSLVKLCSFFLPQKIREKIRQMLVSALEGIAGIFNLSNAIGLLILTVVICTVEALIIYTVAVAVGLPLALGNALIVFLFLALGSMIPSSPAQLGTFEFAGLAALAVIELQGSLALTFILTLHILILTGSSVIGVICLLFRKQSLIPIKEVLKR